MRTHDTVPYRKLKNHPMRSPSPDYACNRNTKTTLLQDMKDQLLNRSLNANLPKFPMIPAQLMKKKSSKIDENDKQVTGSNKNNRASTTITKKQGNNFSDVKISNFQSSKFDKSQIFEYIQSIYQTLKMQKGLKDEFTNKNYTQQQKALNRIKIIKTQIQKIFQVFNQNQSKAFVQKQLQASPIENGKIYTQQDSITFYQNNELIIENTKLKRQINYLQNQLVQLSNKNGIYQNEYTNKNKIKHYIAISGIAEQSIQQDSSSLSSTACQFLRQKITYLQNQLQNKILKISNMEAEKQQQIRQAEEYLTNKNKALQNQLQQCHKIIQEYKFTVKKFEQSSKSIVNAETSKFRSQKRNRFSSQTIKLDNENQKQLQLPKLIIANKRGLSWDKQQVLSLYDPQFRKQQSLYSQTEKVDIEHLFQLRKQLSAKVDKIKEHYQEIINKNSRKHHQQLQNLQNQLTELRLFLQRYINCEHQNENRFCQNCLQYQKQLNFRKVQLLDIIKQMNMIKQQINQQKQQNKKLRNLIQHAFCNQSNKKSEKKSKSKIQKIGKKNSKSEKKLIEEQQILNTNQKDEVYSADKQKRQEQIKQSVVYQYQQK